MKAGTTMTTIGESTVIKGELSADEDLVIEGRVEGKITSKRCVLTVGEHGSVEAAIVAHAVVVAGKVRGDILATKRVEFRDTCSVEGDIAAPAVVIALGAQFRGGIDMWPPQGGEPTAARASDNAAAVLDKPDAKDAPGAAAGRGTSSGPAARGRRRAGPRPNVGEENRPVAPVRRPAQPSKGVR